MKKPLLLCSAVVLSGLLLGTSASFADPGTEKTGKSEKPNRDPAARLEKMKTELGLSDEQATSVSSIMADTKFSMEQIKNNTALTDEQRREQGREAMQLSRSRIDAILTPEQKEKFSSMRPERKNMDKPKKEGKGKPEKSSD